MMSKTDNSDKEELMSGIGLPSGLNSDENEENVVELQEDWGDEYNDVVTLLCGLHMNEFVEMFVQQGINLDIFLNLNESDLCHIGLTSSQQRAALLDGIAQLKKHKAERTDETSLKGLSMEEVMTILTNTQRHLTVMHASLAHTRLSLRSPAVHNSLITHTISSAQLLSQLCAKASVQAEHVANQTRAILSKKPGTSYTNNGIRWKISLSAMASIGAVCILIFCGQKFYKLKVT